MAGSGWVVVDVKPRTGTGSIWRGVRYVVRYVAVPERDVRYGNGIIATGRFGCHQDARDEADRLNLADQVLAS